MDTEHPTAIELELEALPESVPVARHAVNELAADLGADAGAVRIVVSELVGNAVVHAYVGLTRGLVVVVADVLLGRLVVTVADGGRGMVPRLDSPGLGFGLPIATKLAHDVRIESDERGTVVSASFDISGSIASPPTELRSAVDREIARARRLIKRSGSEAQPRMAAVA